MILRFTKALAPALYMFFFAAFSEAQNPYTQMRHGVDTQLNIRYGTAVDYAGNSKELYMDLYKPVGDSNCLRPVIVLVHGGAWVGGNRTDAGVVRMAREMAQRGWVAACISYRLGNHKTSSYSMYALCNGTSLSQPCGYICDSAEVYRANYRGMQDAKGAVRFLKMRHLTDSTDPANVFIAGESAGGFVALATAFTDKASEKHPSCDSIADAPVPDPDFAAYGCSSSPSDRKRPDLGTVEGDLNLYPGGPDASVRGAGSIFGGVLDTGIFRQTGQDVPVVYMFHQGSDIIVHYRYGKLMGRVNYECYAPTNICQPYYFYPGAWGSESIRSHFLTMGSAAPVHRAEVVSNYNYMNNCFSNGHSVDDYGTRIQQMCELFAERIRQSGNDPALNCTRNAIQTPVPFLMNLYPNPADRTLNIMVSDAMKGCRFTLWDAYGRVVLNGVLEKEIQELDIRSLQEGVYYLTVSGMGTRRFCVVHRN